jgi:hypothetical protein
VDGSVKFAAVNTDDLVIMTMLLRQIKPNCNNSVVYGIEQPLPNDRSIVFHTVDPKSSERDIVMIGIEFLNSKLKDFYLQYGREI